MFDSYCAFIFNESLDVLLWVGSWGIIWLGFVRLLLVFRENIFWLELLNNFLFFGWVWRGKDEVLFIYYRKIRLFVVCFNFIVGGSVFGG